MRMRALAERMLTLGVTASDNDEVIRQKRIMLVVHYAVLFGGPFPNVVLYLISSMPWVALVNVLSGTLPVAFSFAVYYRTHHFWASTWMASLMPIASPFLITIFGGGIQNAGILIHYMFVSPLIWICITRKVGVGLILFLVSTIGITLNLVFEDQLFEIMVHRWGVAPELPGPWRRWHWWFNVIQLQFLNFALFGYAMQSLGVKIRQQAVLSDQIDDLAQKMVKLELESITPPPAGAHHTQRSLYAMVERIRAWRPFIPATLFLLDGGQDDDEEEDNNTPDADDDGRIPLSDSATLPPDPHDLYAATNDSGPAPSTRYHPTSEGRGAAAPPAARLLQHHPHSMGSSASKQALTHVPHSQDDTMSIHSLHSDKEGSSLADQPIAPVDVPGTPHSSSSATKALKQQLQRSKRATSKPSVHLHNNGSSSGRPSVEHRGGVDGYGDLQLKNVTVGMLTARNLLHEGMSKRTIGERMSLFATALANGLQKENGATHQFHGDAALCVWLGANQQVRAAAAMLKVLAEIESSATILSLSGPTTPSHKRPSQVGTLNAVRVYGALASGRLVCGSVGSVQKLSVFYGTPTKLCEQLSARCLSIAGRLLCDGAVASQIEYHCDVLPVDVLESTSDCPAPSSGSVFEVCGVSAKEKVDEWMYQLSSEGAVGGLKKEFHVAFASFRAGLLNDAVARFAAVLESHAKLLTSMPIAQAHLRRLLGIAKAASVKNENVG